VLMNVEGLPGRARRLRPGDPRWIGPYEVIGFLGEGGMGQVFLGRDTGGVLIAIKLVRPEMAGFPEFRARFRREAQSAMRVPRFCTAEVIAADPDAAAPYLVTEYIDGPTLEEAVRTEGPLRGAELDQLAVSMAAALASIHGAGIIHRDLKPANVLLSRLGPRVIDFGIAGAVDATRLTDEGRSLGTPAYMAPEQLHARPHPASDVFSWGGVMLFAATGRRPFSADSLPALAAKILQARPDLTGLPPRLAGAVAAAMRKDPATRPTPANLLELLGVPADHPDQVLRTRLEALLPASPAPPRSAPAATQPGHHGWPAASGYPAAQPPAASGRPAPSALSRQPAPQPPGPPRYPTQAEPPVTQTRMDGARTDEPFPSHQLPPPDAPARGDYPDQDPLPEKWQTTWTPPPTRRRKRSRLRKLLPVLISIALVAATVIWLLLQSDPGPLKVTAADVQVDDRTQDCDADVDIMATLITNGAPGQITYQWHRSDQKQPDPPRQQAVRDGDTQTTVHLLWEINGTGRRTFTATFTVLNNPALQKSASFTYTCRE
jgi:serine/threonine protein kinase